MRPTHAPFPIRPALTAALLLLVAVAPARAATAADVETAEAFIDAFYSFDPARLAPLLEEADETAARILYYQGWAEGGNYAVVERAPCAIGDDARIHCPITVEDDPVKALKTGFNVTDTFHLTFENGRIARVETSSNDQPIYYQARKWVEENLPELIAEPCKDRGTAAGTPGDCARAMTEGYRRFAASDDFPGTP
jgi:hypothetical protein